MYVPHKFKICLHVLQAFHRFCDDCTCFIQLDSFILALTRIKSSFNVIDIIKVKLFIPASLNKSSSYAPVVQRSTTDRDQDDQQWQRQPEGTYSCNECIFHTYIYTMAQVRYEYNNMFG